MTRTPPRYNAHRFDKPLECAMTTCTSVARWRWVDTVTGGAYCASHSIDRETRHDRAHPDHPQAQDFQAQEPTQLAIGLDDVHAVEHHPYHP